MRKLPKNMSNGHIVVIGMMTIDAVASWNVGLLPALPRRFKKGAVLRRV